MTKAELKTLLLAKAKRWVMPSVSRSALGFVESQADPAIRPKSCSRVWGVGFRVAFFC